MSRAIHSGCNCILRPTGLMLDGVCLFKVVELKDREMALLTEQLAKLQNMEVAPDNKVTRPAIRTQQ